MKKIIILFAVALVGLCANAEVSEFGPCPSQLKFALLNAENPAQVEVELQLVNASHNLNGFNMEIEKAQGSEAVQWKKVSRNYFTAKGYAATILAMLEDSDDDEREELLSEMCDVKNNVKDDHLVIIEILSTLDCRFFPVLENPTGIGKFYLDMSACEDGNFELVAPDTPTGCSFSYTKAPGQEVCPEPLTAWTADAPITVTLNKAGDEITQVETAISTIAVDQPVDNRIFDLQGRELQSVPEHGIYIQNGKKYVK